VPFQYAKWQQKSREYANHSLKVVNSVLKELKMPNEKITADLIALSHAVGLENRHLAILGEGNTSADCGDGTFLVKASGSSPGVSTGSLEKCT
jgi:hypothetical protein